MRFNQRLLKVTLCSFMALGLMFMSACAPKNRDLTTDRGTMIEGDRLMSEEFFEEARKQYTRIKTEFPNSNLQVEADLKIAETYYRDESYPAAASAFEEFIKTYPGRPEVPEALFKLGMCHVKQMPSNFQRDTRAAQKAVDVLTRLLVDYPTNTNAQEAQKHIEEARNMLAEKVFAIGRFYERRKQYLSAARRYAELLDQYPENKFVEEAMAREALTRKLAGEVQRSEELAQRFLAKYPQSEYKSLVESK